MSEIGMRRPSMIKNLVASLPERGKIKIGIKGEMITSSRGRDFQPPQKLDHFIVTTMRRGPDNNFVRDETFHATIGNAPTEISVRLLWNDPALNFPTRYACYVGRTLWCSGDGETATRISQNPREVLGDSFEPKPQTVTCPCHRKEPSYNKADKCKMNGNLSVLIDGMGGVGGVWKFRTTSYNTIVGILSSMAFIGSITGGVLANIPLRLRLSPKQATNPIDGSQLLIYVVTLEFAGDIGELQKIGHRVALERARTHVGVAHVEDQALRMLELSPPANAVLPGDDPDEIVDEFYPEQAKAATTPPPRPKLSDFDDREEIGLEDGAPKFEIVGIDGEIFVGGFEDATARLVEDLAEAKSRDHNAIAGLYESNERVIADLDAARGNDGLRTEFAEALAEADEPDFISADQTNDVLTAARTGGR